MANVVKRANPNQFQVVLLANTPDYPPADWVINPVQLPTLIGNGSASNPQIPKLYWIIDPPGSSNLREMTTQEKALVDGDPQDVLDARLERKALLRQTAEDFLISRYDDAAQRHFLVLRWTATAGQLTAINNWLAWYKTVLQTLDNQLALVDQAPTVTLINSVLFNTAPFVLTDPGVNVQQAI